LHESHSLEKSVARLLMLSRSEIWSLADQSILAACLFLINAAKSSCASHGAVHCDSGDAVGCPGPTTKIKLQKLSYAAELWNFFILVANQHRLNMFPDEMAIKYS
jgi:hypothetical protein